MPSFRWSTEFATPAALANLALTVDAEHSWILAAVDASSDEFHEAYVWEVQDQDGQWVEIERTTDAELTYRLAALNVETRIRVRDWIGSADDGGYSEPVDAAATVEHPLWWLVHTGGDEEFTVPLEWASGTITTEVPLDQVVLQPLSGADGEMAAPIVITGQYQGERVSLSMVVERPTARLLQRAARLAPGSIALKDPKGPVYVAQLGGLRLEDRDDGFWRLTTTATRVG